MTDGQTRFDGKDRAFAKRRADKNSLCNATQLHRRTSRGAGGGLQPPTFGQFNFLGNDENLGGRPGKGFLKINIFFR